MGLLGTLLAACTGASQQWSRQATVEFALDGIGRVVLPKTMNDNADPTARTPDYNVYNFRKPYKSHLNGQSSIAENLSVYVFAPDFPRARFDAMLTEGQVSGFGKNPGSGTDGEHGLRWLVQEITYERSPVVEPSWNIRVDDRERGLVVTWRGFKKHYTLAQAKDNLASLFDRITINAGLAADFASRRSWPVSGWEASYATNLRVAKSVLAEKQFSLEQTDSIASKGLWSFYLDDERPQQLHVIHALTAMTMPDFPFRLTEPVTYYKYMQSRWYQDNQGQESDLLPPKAQSALARNFTDRARIYFFQMTAVDLWKAYPSEVEFANTLRALLRKVETEHTRLLRDGFIAGDAEP